MSTPGIEVRHGRDCRSQGDGACDCTPSVRAWVYDRRTKNKIRQTFTGKGAKAAAKAWRQDAGVGLRKGTLRAPSATTIRVADL